MKERIAQSALLFGLCYMVCVTALYLGTGGFTTELLGIRITLDNLNKPIVITLACLVVWLTFAKHGMAKTFNAIASLEHLSLQSHKKIACFLGLGAAFSISLLKLKQH